MLNNLFIKALQQPNTIFTPFYEMSFVIYNFLNKIPFIKTPILYRFTLQTKYKHLLFNFLEKIYVYYYRYNKLQAAMHENFSADKYKDGLTIVNLAIGIPIFNDMNLVFTVISAKKAGLNIIMIGVKDLNRIIKRKRLYHLYKIV